MPVKIFLGGSEMFHLAKNEPDSDAAVTHATISFLFCAGIDCARGLIVLETNKTLIITVLQEIVISIMWSDPVIQVQLKTLRSKSILAGPVWEQARFLEYTNTHSHCPLEQTEGWTRAGTPKAQQRPPVVAVGKYTDSRSWFNPCLFL